MNTTRIFKSGDSQAVRLPKDFRLLEKEVYIRKEGNLIMILPITESPWDVLEHSFHYFSDDIFATGREQPQLPEFPTP